MYKDEEKALEALNRALDLGITYFDTAYGYGRGLSEERVGKVLKTRGKGIFLATKINERNAEKAMPIIEGSLKRLQRDRLDLLHIHALGDAEDLAAVEAKGGILELLYKLRDQKVTRFIGITSHTHANVLKMALERHDFDSTQMALNGAMAVMKSAPGGFAPDLKPGMGFEQVALPVALRKKMGVTAMKVFGQQGLVDHAPADQLVRYCMSLPVASAVVGMPQLEHIAQNAAVAKSFRPMSKEEMRKLSGDLSAKHSARLSEFFRDHTDA
jgi:predicted aldo/keto reductase-like oxidoreductase